MFPRSRLNELIHAFAILRLKFITDKFSVCQIYVSNTRKSIQTQAINRVIKLIWNQV